jgi:hypothetical protein
MTRVALRIVRSAGFARFARFARLVLVIASAALVWACNAPFIPVTPPGETATFPSALVADGNGGQKTVWTAHGPAAANVAYARFYVFDASRGAGVIAQAMSDGSYTTPPMDGAMGDRVEISYETLAGALSARTCFLLTTEVQPTAGGPSAPRCPN